jgi:hypothetical protein
VSDEPEEIDAGEPVEDDPEIGRILAIVRRLWGEVLDLGIARDRLWVQFLVPDRPAPLVVLPEGFTGVPCSPIHGRTPAQDWEAYERAARQMDTLGRDLHDEIGKCEAALRALGYVPRWRQRERAEQARADAARARAETRQRRLQAQAQRERARRGPDGRQGDLRL